MKSFRKRVIILPQMLSTIICIKETKVLFLIVEKLAANQKLGPPHRWTMGWDRNSGRSTAQEDRAGKCVLIDRDGLMPHIDISTPRSVNLVPGVCFYCYRKRVLVSILCWYRRQGFQVVPTFHMSIIGHFHVGRSMSKSWVPKIIFNLKNLIL